MTGNLKRFVFAHQVSKIWPRVYSTGQHLGADGYTYYQGCASRPLSSFSRYASSPRTWWPTSPPPKTMPPKPRTRNYAVDGKQQSPKLHSYGHVGANVYYFQRCGARSLSSFRAQTWWSTLSPSKTMPPKPHTQSNPVPVDDKDHVWKKQLAFLGEEMEGAPLEFTSGEELMFMDLDTGCGDIVLGYQDVGQENVKVVLAIHDTPGFSEDFKNLFEPLKAQGYRVIALNLPGYGISHSCEGVHDTDQNVQVIKQLLQKLKVEKLSGVVSEGSGCVLACNMAANTDMVGSLIILNPSGFAPLSEDRWYRDFRSTLSSGRVSTGDAAAVIHGFEPRKDNVMPLVTALDGEMSIVYEEVKELAEQIGRKGLPILSITATDDLLSNTNDTIALAKTCGVDNSHVKYVQDNEPTPATQPVSSALVFKSGGHRTLSSHPDVVANHVLWILKASEDGINK